MSAEKFERISEAIREEEYIEGGASTSASHDMVPKDVLAGLRRRIDISG